jgi:hypothetical protein
MKYEYETKPQSCPVCKSLRIADILYGLLPETPELTKKIEEGTVVTGGCIVWDACPVWMCFDCKTKIYRIEI